MLLYTNGSDRSFIGMRTSEILFNHTCAVHGLFPTCTCYVSQLEKWSVIDFYWFAATGFGINPFLLSEKAVVISAFQGCFFFRGKQLFRAVAVAGCWRFLHQV